jgi:hypothetical protein
MTFTEYFNRYEGPLGIHKWKHYLPIYDRHLLKFKGSMCNVLEIGVHSGGSLCMWRDVLGVMTRVYGVDIDPRCTDFRLPRINVFEGDATKPEFWRSDPLISLPQMNVIIDDGSHRGEDQQAVFDNVWPLLRNGGVYICEDITTADNVFLRKMLESAAWLNSFVNCKNTDDPEQSIIFEAASWNQEVMSVQFYPMMVIIEKRANKISALSSAKRGYQWIDGTKSEAA